VNPIYSPVIHRFSKNRRSLALLFLLSLILVPAFAFFDSDPILFQSRESKTEADGPVFNRVSYRPGWSSDVWVMQQGHNGNDDAFANWDRIAIVVEHDAAKSAVFYQLTPGDLFFEEEAVSLKRVACFSCHSNGPRAIRPDFTAAPVTAWDRMRVILWNIRIKSYGPLKSQKQDHDPAFRIQAKVANDKLQVGACTQCHNSSEVFGRGDLTRQNFPMINFMLKEDLMPPHGFKISQKERDDILQFIGR